MDLKPALTLEQQVEAVRAKGFIVADKKAVADFINRVGYYRIRAYMLAFRAGDGYEPGIDFERVIHLYQFDNKLRAWFWPILGDIECYMRTQIASHLAHKYGAEAHLDAGTFDPIRHKYHTEYLRQIERAIKNNSNAPVIKHHKRKYGGRFPIWVIIEFYTTGMLSFTYADLKTADQKQIARNAFGVGNLQVESWLRAFTELRNACAHYARLYGVQFSTAPRDFKGAAYTMDRRLFSQIYMLKQLHPDAGEWTQAVAGLAELLSDFRDFIDTPRLGFPTNWRELLA
ncbi:MAG: Abi family protein [Microbacteriaceae bacterium]|nr:Abi family protein [Microbacteriaceae bacterium]